MAWSMGSVATNLEIRQALFLPRAKLGHAWRLWAGHLVGPQAQARHCMCRNQLAGGWDLSRRSFSILTWVQEPAGTLTKAKNISHREFIALQAICASQEDYHANFSNIYAIIQISLLYISVDHLGIFQIRLKYITDSVLKRELWGANPSTRGLGWVNLSCTSCFANSSAGQLSWYGRTAAPREILLYTSSRTRFLNRTLICERCKHREVWINLVLGTFQPSRKGLVHILYGLVSSIAATLVSWRFWHRWFVNVKIISKMWLK